eukprot:scaffold5206_cov95-Cylindrotheca_fusiformis.AAC.1
MPVAYTYHGHTRDETVECSAPSRGQKELNGSDVVLGAFGVDGPECDARGNHCDEHEEGNSNRLGVEVGHLLAPMGSDGRLHVMDDSASKGLRRRRSMMVGIVRRVILSGPSAGLAEKRLGSGCWFAVAESWHDEGCKFNR